MLRSLPRHFPTIRYLCPLLLLGAAACATAGDPRETEVGPMSAEECAREAQGISRNGRSASETFDSTFAEAQRRTTPPEPKPGEPKLDRPPALAKGAAIGPAMSRLYPPELLFTRRGGVAMMALLIRSDGWPDKIRVLRSSGFPTLDAASVEVARQMRFSPGVYRECPVWVFTLMPITWQPGPPPPGQAAPRTPPAP